MMSRYGAPNGVCGAPSRVSRNFGAFASRVRRGAADVRDGAVVVAVDEQQRHRRPGPRSTIRHGSLIPEIGTAALIRWSMQQRL